MAERAPEKREVTGSTPVPTTVKRRGGTVLALGPDAVAEAVEGDDGWNDVVGRPD